MTALLASAHRYLIRPDDAFWEWRDGGDVIAWTDGPTIVFRRELAEVLRRFENRGLPPLNAVLFLLAACKENWREERQRLSTEILTHVYLALTPSDLDRVPALPPEFRTTASGKAELVAFVFERTPPAVSPGETKLVLEILESGLLEDLLGAARPRQSVRELVDELRLLLGGLDRLDADVLRSRMRTGLDQAVEPAPRDLSPPERMRQLLAQLESDEELAGMARLARNLMAVVHLPRSLTERDDLPLGGISDITNRGPLDRLLLSELAHDDDTLMTRIALNEALYVRREAPPRSPPSLRAMLLDSGIRMWGVPRVFATAAALSLVAVGNPTARVAAYRAGRDRIASVDLLDREGLLAHLEALETAPHPGAALPLFLRTVDSAEAAVEPVVITAEAALADREFQQALAALDEPLIYLASVDRDGRFRLLARTRSGLRLIREARLQLDEILGPSRRPAVPLLDPARDPSRPLILSVEPFPLLLPHELRPERSWFVEDCGAFAVARDGRLLLWQKPRRGALQIAEKIPDGEVSWHTHKPRDGVARAVLRRAGGNVLTMVSVDLNSFECRIVPLQCSNSRIWAVAEHGGVLLVIKSERVLVFDRSSGQELCSEKPHPKYIWTRDRFFHDGGSWYALGYDGRSTVFEPIAPWNAPQRDAYAQMFERDGHEGVLAVTSLGAIAEVATGRLLLDGRGELVHLLGVSSDGHRLILKQGASVRPQLHPYLLDLSERKISPACGDPRLLLEPRLAQYIRPRNLRHRFRSISYDENDRLVLFSPKGAALRFEYVYDRGGLRLRESPDRASGPRFEFQTMQRSPYQLRVAEFNDGSRAWLDARGLLHLRSSDPALPELTLVLTDGETAGWSSAHGVWGSEYYTGGKTQTLSSTGVWDLVQQFVRRLR